jgi:hypothetical protein
MQSNDMIALAQYYFDNRYRRVTNQEVSDELGFSLSQVRSRRSSLRLNFGFDFDINKKGSKLVDITLERDEAYNRQQKERNKRRAMHRKAHVQGVRLANERSFTNAFACMGV